MVFPHSDPFTLLDRLKEAVLAGDWVTAEALTGDLCLVAPPSEPERLEGYLRALREALVSARASRADMAGSSRRLEAASGYGG